MSILSSEYSEKFDELRKNRCEVSFFKYGPIKRNFGERMTNAIGNLMLCLKKYEETHNTEYLCDVANYAMIEFMYPQYDDAYFRATDSSESAGIVGFCIKDIERFAEENG